MGGVIVFKKEHFEKTNGYPIDYVGWGSEDNTLGERVKRVGLKIYQHPYGNFYSVPHVSRLSEKVEYDAHYANGKKREDEKAGKTFMQDNGLSTLDLGKLKITSEQTESYKHIKVRSI